MSDSVCTEIRQRKACIESKAMRLVLGNKTNIQSVTAVIFNDFERSFLTEIYTNHNFDQAYT